MKTADRDISLPGSSTQRLPSWLRGDRFWGLLLFLAVVLAYLPVWHAVFIWDDDMFISLNPCIVGPLGLKEIWTTGAARFYPFVLSTFWAEYKLWGLAPLPYHLLTLFFHAGSAVVLWRVLRNLEIGGAWLGAALWALHPVQVESTAWVAETKNTESCFFYVLTILFFVRGLKAENPRRDDVLAWIFAVLAIASKSSALLLPVVLALCSWWVRGRWSWRDLVKVIPFLLMAILAGIITLYTVQQNGTDELQWARSWPERLAMAGGVFWVYLGKLLWPFPLMTYYPNWEVDTTQWTSYVPLVNIVIVLVILWCNRHSWARSSFFAFTYYLANLLPVMGVFSINGFRYSPVEDHLQYLASMGPLALIGAELARLSNLALSGKWWLRAVLGAVLLLIVGTLSCRQALIYQNSQALWDYNLSQNPNCWLAYKGLGLGLAQKGQVAEGIKLLQKSVEINPNYAISHDDLGELLAQNGQMDEAMAEYRKAVEINPFLANAYYNLGNAYMQKGEVDEAIAQYQKVIEIDSNSAPVYTRLGVVFLQKGQLEEAIEQFQKSLKIDPSSASVHDNLGVALFRSRELDGAIGQFQKALAIDPHSAKDHNNLGLAFIQKGELDGAIEQFQKALAFTPDYVEAHNNFGLALAKKGQMDGALVQFQEALRLRPDDRIAQINLAKVKARIEQTSSAK